MHHTVLLKLGSCVHAVIANRLHVNQAEDNNVVTISFHRVYLALNPHRSDIGASYPPVDPFAQCPAFGCLSRANWHTIINTSSAD